MSASHTSLIAIICYLCAFATQARLSLYPNKTGSLTGKHITLAFSCLALITHMITSWQQIFTESGADFGVLPLSVAIFLIINFITVGASLRQPLHSLFLLLFPLTIIALTLSQLPLWQNPSRYNFPLGLSLHILLSVIAYSLLSIAALEALFLAYQNRQLHHHHTNPLMRALPPLQTMERLLFRLVGIGFTLLTLALISGLLFVDDFLSQHLAHKTVFSLIAWLTYATFLWGRFRLGWRGKTAIHWTLGGFLFLMLAFWGSKFVLEVILI